MTKDVGLLWSLHVFNSQSFRCRYLLYTFRYDSLLIKLLQKLTLNIVMAAVFGAVPFLSAFWASFPAFLELFFGQSQRIKAILLLITAYFPSLFVDSTIYSEIKRYFDYNSNKRLMRFVCVLVRVIHISLVWRLPADSSI